MLDRVAGDLGLQDQGALAVESLARAGDASCSVGEALLQLGASVWLGHRSGDAPRMGAGGEALPFVLGDPALAPVSVRIIHTYILSKRRIPLLDSSRI